VRSRPASDQPVHASQLIQQIFGLPQFLYPSYVTYAELDGYCYGKSVALEGIVLKIDMNAHIVKHFPVSTMWYGHDVIPPLQNSKGKSLGGGVKHIGVGKICDFQQK